MFKEMLISPFSFLAMIHKMFDDQIQMALRKHISNLKFEEVFMQSLQEKTIKKMFPCAQEAQNSSLCEGHGRVSYSQIKTNTENQEWQSK